MFSVITNHPSKLNSNATTFIESPLTPIPLIIPYFVHNTCFSVFHVFHLLFYYG